MAASKLEKVVVVITIDTECDHDPHWVRSKPLTFHSVTEGIRDRLQPVFHGAGAVPTYLVTVEVLENDACVRALRDIKGPHELGTHLHSAFIAPQKKFDDYAGIDSPDFQCHCPPEIEYQKLEKLSALFQRRLGYPPRSFRAGRFGAGANTISSLEKLGYVVDTSVTPHIYWEHPDGGVDYRKAPEQPYLPDANDIARTSKAPRRILEVPVSITRSFLRGRRCWFRPWLSSVRQMKAVAQRLLRRHADQPVVVLNMMFHSMEIIPGATPYPQSDHDVARYCDDLAAVLSWCKEEGFIFSGLTDFALAQQPFAAPPELVPA